MSRNGHGVIEAHACTGKTPHASRREAWTILKRMSRPSDGTGLRPYRCPFCGHWHNGHALTRRRKNRRKGH